MILIDPNHLLYKMDNLGKKEVISQLHDLYANVDENKKRIRVLEILNNLGDNSHFEQVENYFLSDEDAQVRIEAAKLLAFNYDQKRALKPLIWVFDNEMDIRVKYTALRLLVALAHVKPEFKAQVITTLRKALNSKEYKMKMEAAECLGILNVQECFEDLIHELNIDNKQVLLRVIKALERVGDPRAIPYLLHLLGTESVDLWNMTFKAIKKLSKEHDEDLLDSLLPLLNIDEDSEEQSHLRRGMAKALGELKKERAVIPLIEVLDASQYWVRWEAIKALDKIDKHWRVNYKNRLRGKRLSIEK